MKIKNQTGFTVLDLLATVTIVSLLANMLIMTSKNAAMQARDAKRLADMRQIITALEIYYDQYNVYPATSSYGESANVGDCPGGWDCSHADQNGDGQPFMTFLENSGIMEEVPVGPLSSPARHYKYYYYGGSGIAYGCQRPYYVLVGYGFETTKYTDDIVCYTPWANRSDVYVIIGGSK